MSLNRLNESILDELATCINREFIQSFECDHKKIYEEIYEEKQQFKFLPGHRVLLLEWAKKQHWGQQNIASNSTSDETIQINHPAFSPIFRDIIRSALKNHDRPPTGHRFSALLTDFCMYIYIMAGKECYETLSGNICISKAGTMCKYHVSSVASWVGE